MSTHLRTRLVASLATAAALTLLPSTAAGAAAGARSTPCTEVRFDVKGGHVAGSLCGKDPANTRLLLITAHGATYNRSYWDWPQNAQAYSFVERQPRRVTVLNLDLLGAGASSHPASVQLTLPAQASAIHEIVRTMRGRGFDKIVLLGHSSGSGVVTQEAATYHDVDGLIVTGFLHHFATPPTSLAVPLSMYPAMLDPAFAARHLDAGYLTTRPGARGNPGFYNTAVADPDVIAYDDAHKDLVSATHIAGFVTLINDPTVSRKVDVPVLSIVGSFDGGFCDAPGCPQERSEAAAWSPAARLETRIVYYAGHDIHLHGGPYAATEFGFIRDWLARRFESPVASAAAAPAPAKPLFASQTRVTGTGVFPPQGPAELNVGVLAEVTPLVFSPLGMVTHPTVTFALTLPDAQQLTFTAPVLGPCLSPVSSCLASAFFHVDVDCAPTDPGIWVTATFSGESLAPPTDRAISGPSTSEPYWFSRCPIDTGAG